MSKYIIAYSEKDKKGKEVFIYGGVVTKQDYDQIKKNRYFYDQNINETVFVSKIKLLEVTQEDDILS